MRLIKDGAWYDDVWCFLADDEPLAAAGKIAVSLKRWRQEKESLLAGGSDGLAVVLASDDYAEDIGDDCQHLAMIAVTLPVFRDGRAFSTARLLRQRYGFQGELRACGHILQDQLAFLLRCGVDVVEVDDRISLEDWQEALAELPYVYQPACDRKEAIVTLRHKDDKTAG